MRNLFKRLLIKINQILEAPLESYVPHRLIDTAQKIRKWRYKT